MTKHIQLFGAGKSATCLIAYLLKQCALYNWHLTVADQNLTLAQSKTGNSTYGHSVRYQANNGQQRAQLIAEADLVISLLPPLFHAAIAKDCLQSGKNLLTASYLDKDIKALEPAILEKGLLFLCEMGLDPGLDHMSAIKLIRKINSKGGKIDAFKSHCGGLVAPESDDNPWHYKISWNPANIVKAGHSGAVYKKENRLHNITYGNLFNNCKEVAIPNFGNLAYYPNRDSVFYQKLYDLETAATFIRTTLRHPDFCRGWHGLVEAGLTQTGDNIASANLTFRKWSEKLRPNTSPYNSKLYEFLGLFDHLKVPVHLQNSAEILQYLLEKNLMMQPFDKDLVLMLHQIEFTLDNKKFKTESLLNISGKNSSETAMAKTVGLPLGIAASLVLQGKISIHGLHLPVVPEIYEPVLKELELEGIHFNETDIPL